jgi:cyclopropane fatty-acyl-phospholipid synthase-like methyltransferase
MQQHNPAMTNKPFAESAERNGAPIQDVLVSEFANCSSVLEIGSGTGQHAARFAAAMPHLSWRCSDLAENHEAINAWVAASKLENLLPAELLDIRQTSQTTSRFDAVYSSNTAHIMSFETVIKMFVLVGKTLNDAGKFCLYGPFRQHGKFNTPSNEAFDRSLRERNAGMGIRDLEDLDEQGRENGLDRVRLYAMPANNHLAVWRKEAA